MQLWETVLVWGAGTAYFLSGCFHIPRLRKLHPLAVRLSGLMVTLGLAANTLALVARAINARHAPVAGLYEFGLAVIWGMIVYYVFLEYRCRHKLPGLLILPAAALLTGLAACFYHQARPLAPALKSNWLLAHATFGIIAYSALAVSFILSCAYCWRYMLETRRPDSPLTALLPSLDSLDLLTNQSIFFALPFLTLLILTGSVWAESVWGTYWSWDPKETWSLLTWTIYVIYLHGRISLGWRGKKAIGWAITGFLAVLFTFFGVSLLQPGLHSYSR